MLMYNQFEILSLINFIIHYINVQKRALCKNGRCDSKREPPWCAFAHVHLNTIAMVKHHVRIRSI